MAAATPSAAAAEQAVQAEQEFLLTIGPGGAAMQRLVEEELRACLGVSDVERCGQARFFFRAAADELDKFLLLRAPEKVSAVVLRCRAETLQHPVDQEEAEAALAALVAGSPGWPSALATWRAFARLGTSDPDLLEALPRSFRATGKKAGRRAAHLSSNGVAEFVGEALADVKGWRVDLHDYDVEVVVHLNDDFLVVSLPLLERGSQQQNFFALKGLSQPVAWAMARSVEPMSGELVVDPMCGSGIVLFEAAQCWQGAYYLGFDNDSSQLERSIQNLQMVGPEVAQSLSLARGDARRLPLLDASVDAIVCDLPFGKQFGSEEGNVELYPAVVAEFHRVLKPGSGRAVLLTNKANSACLADALSAEVTPWQVSCRRRILLGYMEAVLFVATALPANVKDEGLMAATSGKPLLPKESCRLHWEDNNQGRRRWTAMKAVLRRPMRFVSAGKKCAR
ncbi:unnamed protein product [Polarella glacialis]|uniref:Ribosomal RNA large subunit methyltransferase K/L-like methyltransferase domain-containing protein n=2 Tax=Polarella glacialis TaxID=89957 RepID=A0A813JXR9_POLGL|nr:unnamed protein product [Polarella glacialis]